MLLAWFAYLLGTSGCAAMPAGFGGHALIGFAAQGPASDDIFLIEVRHDGGPAVTAPVPAACDLMADPGRLTGRAHIEAVAQAIIDEASALAPAAKAAAAVAD